MDLYAELRGVLAELDATSIKYTLCTARLREASDLLTLCERLAQRT